MKDSPKIVLVGAGPVGCLLATMLVRRGFAVDLYEKRPDLRARSIDAGRSINLVLTRRGLAALDRVGAREQILELTVPVLGRMMHDLEGELAYQPYGKDPSECNYSVSRSELNAALLDIAEQNGVKLYFNHALVDVRPGDGFDAGQLTFRHGVESVEVVSDVIIGTDGAPSAVRKALVEGGHVKAHVDMMPIGYKELLFPAADDGSYAMAGHALHIWPRGHHFLMGLANLDGSFTGTLYLPLEGPESFSALATSSDVDAYFEAFYPDAIPVLGDYAQELVDHPLGTLGTVRCAPWHLDARVLLVGDAAHGIVPFFGQGLNAGFEDCAVLDTLFDAHPHGDSSDLARIFAIFSETRKPDADAIADMALENFVEMSEKVGDREFLKRKKVEAILEREFGDRYRSRYATVMYSDTPYRVAFDIGKVQAELLLELTKDLDSPQDVDLDKARALIAARLTPLYAHHGVDLNF